METQNLLENKYEHYQHSVGVMIMHLEWCTKYRYKMFQKEENLKLAEACIRRAASLHEIKIIKISVMPEHVHCIVAVVMNLSASKALQLLKGISSRLFFKHQEKAKLRYPRGHLWSEGKFASSIGFTDLDTVNHYVANQKEHHLGNRTL